MAVKKSRRAKKQRSGPARKAAVRGRGAAARRGAARGKAASGRGASAAKRGGAGVEFNHAMIYTGALDRSLEFYRDRLGFKVVDSYPGAYARLLSPGGGTTIALHVLDEGQQIDPKTEGMRLYFEVRDLDTFCKGLAEKGVVIDKMPEDMPWGWRHAYLKDPDGHEVSLYWAGAARLRKTVMRDEPH
jgi:catechol 2,3-dioxygenase-like lactoylglutathione lyase family enzyme